MRSGTKVKRGEKIERVRVGKYIVCLFSGDSGEQQNLDLPIRRKRQMDIRDNSFMPDSME